MRKHYDASLFIWAVALTCTWPFQSFCNCVQQENVTSINSGFNHQDSRRSLSSDELAETEKVLQLIETCPAWFDLTENDNDASQKILNHLKQLSGFDIAVIRYAVNQYIQRHTVYKEDHLSHMSRLYVLNRYLFKVPDMIPRDKIVVLGGWIGAPVNNSQESWSWPLSVNDEGQLVLTVSPVRYMGPSYRAIEEFDFFYRKFGLRRLPWKKGFF